ncbi:MAG TPA: 4-hydroxythreonine-4-phosphate dehydrogenase PdxA [Ignavibacteriales bacterium]|nr:4-hydroxythreonine-4-phosphate dehydrogenase PdxA [Ignavibacteriales bacterium]
MKKLSIGITCGDINGIGPEIALKAIHYFSKTKNIRFIFIVPENIYEYYSKILNLPNNFKIVTDIEQINDNNNYIFSLGKIDTEFGKPSKISGEISYKAIETSYLLYKNNKIDAVTTAPISKEALNLSGINFPGHTEIYANFEKNSKYTMTFLSKKFNAALTTIHIPLKNVSKELTQGKLLFTIENVVTTAKKYLNILSPKVAILGLNPHAGENGLIGNEENEIIKPSIENSKYREFVYGPFVPDAFFAKKLFLKYDFVIGHYHDQVLIPFKLINFDQGVNYTAGLKIIRTSPDHGTAFDITNKNIANPQSMVQAIKYSIKFAKNSIAK